MRLGHPGLVSSSVSPDGTTTTYTYNAAGQVITTLSALPAIRRRLSTPTIPLASQFCTVAPSRVCPRCDLPELSTIVAAHPGARLLPRGDHHDLRHSRAPDTGDQPARRYQLHGLRRGRQRLLHVAPAEAATGVTCPSSPPSSPPTLSSDPYAGGDYHDL